MILGLHVTGFATGSAIILAIFAKANVKLPTAQPAIFGAGAAAFHLLAYAAYVILGHRPEIIPIWACRQHANVHALQAWSAPGRAKPAPSCPH
jgi:hypothetical protein